ncbi:MAG: sulfatase-like hydrolase/transferase, partial [Anaerolineales bacterium]|nr:sulfatase-like hydrolase/transferase [Anaerolineales bacterium]
MPERPNILLIMTDEHHRDVAGFAGDPLVQTPNLDRLAARGVRFDHATCANPVCTPSRMTMLTGLESHRCAAWSNHWIIFPEHLTWPAHFANHGYRTCLVGKMHFGGRDQMQGFQHRPYGDLRHGLGHQPDPLHMYLG